MGVVPLRAPHFPTGDPRKPTSICPFCGVTTTFDPIKWNFSHWIAKCDACGREFYARVKLTGAIRDDPTFEVLETYPKYVPEKHIAIPEHIWDDYSEACRCLDVKANKATVTMCRRTMQNICLDKGATKKDPSGRWITLRNQIKQAFPGAQYEFLRQLSDEIKYFGDYGAHPQEDGIDEVSEDDAIAMANFTKSFLEITYIQPYEVQQRFRKRKSK